MGGTIRGCDMFPCWYLRPVLFCGLLAMAVGCSCRTSEQELAKHLKLWLTADQGSAPYMVEFSLRFANTGTRILMPRLGPEALILLVDGHEVPAQWKWDGRLLRRGVTPQMPVWLTWEREEHEAGAWLGTGAHRLQLCFGNIRSDVLNVVVSADGSVTYEPRTPVKSPIGFELRPYASDAF